MSLLEMTSAGGVMILVITVLRAVFLNKLPKKTFMILCEIAMLRLILPISIPSVTSIYSLISAIGNTYRAYQAITESTLTNIPQFRKYLLQQKAR